MKGLRKTHRKCKYDHTMIRFPSLFALNKPRWIEMPLIKSKVWPRKRIWRGCNKYKFLISYHPRCLLTQYDFKIILLRFIGMRLYVRLYKQIKTLKKLKKKTGIHIRCTLTEQLWFGIIKLLVVIEIGPVFFCFFFGFFLLEIFAHKKHD